MRKLIGLVLAALIGIGTSAALAGNPERGTISGTTAGIATCVETVTGPVKHFLCRLAGYQNASATPQRFTFRSPFTVAPLLLANSDPKSSVDRRGVTLPTMMSSPADAWISGEGW